MSYQLSSHSRDRLEGLHPDLARVVKLAIHITPVDFTVIEGVRTEAKQHQLLAAGATTTLKSRHIPSYVPKLGGQVGHAVDLAAWVDGGVRWDWPLYDRIADAMKDAARTLGVPLEWGGDWRTFKDGPHFQLPWRDYP